MDEAARLRRKDTTKGPPLRILSLDGGGVRGYSMLIILQELMHRTFVEIEGRAPKRHEIPKPADHFDLIAGTGTGGLIAIMLGRLRLDIDTCKDVYVRMTRRVFETDKTFAGIPYKSTLFKASKLEEAIRDCVREHTVSEYEGNDVLANATPMSAATPKSPLSGGIDSPQRTMSQSSKYSQLGMSPIGPPRNFGSMRWGNPNALLYDTRELRTKTAVTAMYAGKRAHSGSSMFLRSYDSRKEPAPDVNCTIWQAGRATSATGLAFKPVRIGQSVYHDEGSGKFNPSPQVLDEAVLNEWPGREVGVFVSIGTGRRPGGTNSQQHEWWEGFMGGSIGDFAEARRRLIAKIEGCEDTHQFMLHEHIAARQMNPENYYRLNVEVGVGEFGMNEWNRLSDISTNTRMYLSKSEVQSINLGASSKLGRIHLAKQRHDRAEIRKNLDGPGSLTASRHSWQSPWDARPQQQSPPPSNPVAVELPGSDPYFSPTSAPYEHRPSVTDQKFTVVSDDSYPQPTDPDARQQNSQQPYSPYPAPLHPHHHHTASNPGSPYVSPTYPPNEYHQGRPSYEDRPSPPPLPPKTPLPYPENGNAPSTFMNMGSLGRNLPYPDVEGPPPVVNQGTKPTMSR